jgi:hypothetical protein
LFESLGDLVEQGEKGVWLMQLRVQHPTPADDAFAPEWLRVEKALSGLIHIGDQKGRPADKTGPVILMCDVRDGCRAPGQYNGRLVAEDIVAFAMAYARKASHKRRVKYEPVKWLRHPYRDPGTEGSGGVLFDSPLEYKEQVLDGDAKAAATKAVSGSGVWAIHFYTMFSGDGGDAFHAVWHQVVHSLGGLVNVAAIDAHKSEDIASFHGLHSNGGAAADKDKFPKVLLYGADKRAPLHFGGDMADAAALVDRTIDLVSELAGERLRGGIFDSTGGATGTDADAAAAAGNVPEITEAAFRWVGRWVGWLAGA